jgi:hypothetical protein
MAVSDDVRGSYASTGKGPELPCRGLVAFLGFPLETKSHTVPSLAFWTVACPMSNLSALGPGGPQVYQAESRCGWLISGKKNWT